MINYDDEWVTVEEYQRIKSGEQSSTTGDSDITTGTTATGAESFDLTP